MLPLLNIPSAAMIVEGLGTIHQLLLSLEEEAQTREEMAGRPWRCYCEVSAFTSPFTFVA